MQAYRVEKTVKEDGELELHALPFRAGEQVEVIILSCVDKSDTTTSQQPSTRNLSLKGKVLKYENPTEPVGQNDWNVLK